MHKQIKRTIVMSLILVSSSICFAGHAANMKDSFKDACPPPPALHDGFYVGLQGGYDFYRVRQKISLAGGVNSNPVLNAIGTVGGIFVGFGKPIIRDRIYLGGEFLANSSNASTAYSSTLGAPIGAYTAKYVVNSSYGGAFLPGYYITPSSLAYARFGYTYAKMKYTESFAGTSAAKSKTSSGMNLGFGIETLLHQQFSGRLEYTHVFYNSFTTSNSTVSNPSDNQVLVALLYHFS